MNRYSFAINANAIYQHQRWVMVFDHETETATIQYTDSRTPVQYGNSGYRGWLTEINHGSLRWIVISRCKARRYLIKHDFVYKELPR
jgi:hypothetical protein